MVKYSGLLLIVVVLLGACIAPIPEAPSAATVSQQVDDDHAHVHDDHGTELPEEMGEVNFAVSCTPEAQAEFNHGVAYLHSFWFPPAIDSFNHAAEMDPELRDGPLGRGDEPAQHPLVTHAGTGIGGWLGGG